MRMRLLGLMSILLLSIVAASAQGAPAEIDAALADLSNRVGTTITLSNQTLSNWSWEQTTFNDASLGCPQEGELAAQVITPGFIFNFTYAGTVYEYHVSLDASNVRLCNQAAVGESTDDTPLEEPYSNPLCPAPTTESGPYIRSRVTTGIQVVGALGINRLREQPSTQATIITEIPSNAVFTVIAGPQCDDEGNVWWQVDLDGVVGWTAEGQGSEYFIQPQPPRPLPQRLAINLNNAPDLAFLGKLMGNIVPAIDFSPDGGLLVVAGDSGLDALALYNMSDVTQAPRLVAPDEPPTMQSLDFHPNGQQVLIGNRDGSARIWNIDPNAPLIESLFLQTHQSDNLAVAAHPDGTRFASAGSNALTTVEGDNSFAILLWDIGTVSQQRVFNTVGDVVMALAFSADGTELASVTRAGDLQLWDIATSESSIPTEQPVTSVAYSPNGQFLAAGQPDGSVLLIDAASDTLVTTLSGHLGGINALAFSPDSALLASVSDDGALRLWSTQTDANLSALTVVDDGAAVDVAFSPDGSLIAAAADDNAAHLFGVPAGS